MRILAIPLIILSLLVFSCEDENPVSNFETTDEEAIFNVIIGDNIRLSEIRAFTETVPDTLDFIANPDSSQPIHWHVVDSTVERIPITISDNQAQSPVGLVDQANVNYSIKWYGNFHTMAYNPSADSIERYVKEFEVTGGRTAICQRWGLASSQRRGWLLTSISGATISAGSQTFLQDLRFISPTNDDSLFSGTIAELDSLVRFNTEEQVLLRYKLSSPDDLPYVLIPFENYAYILAEPTQTGDLYEVVVTMPDRNRIYGQFRFYVVNAGDFSGAYRGTGYAYSYRMR